MSGRYLFCGLTAIAITLSQNPLRLAAQGPTDPLSLAEAIAWGVDNNLSVAGQRLNAEVAANNNNYVTAGRAPLVQATLGFNNSFNNQNNPASFINGTFYSGNATAGLQVNYTLFNGYRVRFDLRRLGQLERVSRDQVRQLVETSIFDVGLAYYNAQLAEANARVAREVKAFRSRPTRLPGAAARLRAGPVDRPAAGADGLPQRQRPRGADPPRGRELPAGLYIALDAEPETFDGRALGDTLLFDPRDWNERAVAAKIDSRGQPATPAHATIPGPHADRNRARGLQAERPGQRRAYLLGERVQVLRRRPAYRGSRASSSSGTPRASTPASRPPTRSSTRACGAGRSRTPSPASASPSSRSATLDATPRSRPGPSSRPTTTSAPCSASRTPSSPTHAPTSPSPPSNSGRATSTASTTASWNWNT